MSGLMKILVPFDDNTISVAALEYAAMFASGINAKIIAFHLADPKDYRTKVDFQEDVEEMVNQKLRPKLREIQKSYPDIKKIDVQIRGLSKEISRHILDFAGENDINFIIMRSHGKNKGNDWEKFFQKTNAYKVILEADCPVFTFTKPPENPKLDNILVPLDLTPGTIYKIPLAAAFAKQFNAKIHLFSASEHLDDKPQLQDQLNEIYDDLVGKGLKIVKLGVYDWTLPEGILHLTESKEIDLVIIMNRPGFRWSDLWVSPKAKKIISHCKIPVISFRAEGPLNIDL